VGAVSNRDFSNSAAFVITAAALINDLNLGRSYLFTYGCRKAARSERKKYEEKETQF